MKRYIPNILTIFRIILVPFFVYLVFFNSTKDHILWATIIFIVACITDYFDGLLARKFKVITNFGKIMDPLADKILVVFALLSLALKPINFISIYIVIIILFREISVTILRDYYSRKNIFIPANIWGKLKTVLQMVGIILSLIFYSIQPFLNFSENFVKSTKNLISIYFWLVAVVTILSGMNYIIRKHNK